MVGPPFEPESNRRAVVVTVVVLVAWVALTLAAPLLAPPVSEIAVALGPWGVSAPEETR